MARRARPGKRVIVLDEGANWKGAGTALFLAEEGHEVTIVTPAAAVMSEMARTNADVQLRQRLRQLGGQLITEAYIARWHGDRATVVAFGAACGNHSSPTASSWRPPMSPTPRLPTVSRVWPVRFATSATRLPRARP